MEKFSLNSQNIPTFQLTFLTFRMFYKSVRHENTFKIDGIVNVNPNLRPGGIRTTFNPMTFKDSYLDARLCGAAHSTAASDGRTRTSPRIAPSRTAPLPTHSPVLQPAGSPRCSVRTWWRLRLVLRPHARRRIHSAQTLACQRGPNGRV